MNRLKILVDMNLSPDWTGFLVAAGFEALHWATIGDPRAEDTTILLWARENAYVIFTHDLDFGTLLALTNADGPSILQVRTQDVTPNAIGDLVLSSVRRFESALISGALVVIEPNRSRVRILPLLL